jgi:hypothetical protein
MVRNNKPKLPIENLLEHLKQYKDAVIILGPDLYEDENNVFVVPEESKDIYSRKTMIKNPSVFWQYYNNNIAHTEMKLTNSMSAVQKLVDLNLHNTIIDTNTFTTVKGAIHPNGKDNLIKCVKCNKEYWSWDLNFNTNKVLKCECGGNLKPTVLCYGEKYSTPVYNSVKDAIFGEENGKPVLNTHTLIFIGVDFTDSLVSEIIDSYDALKDNTHFTVVITDKLNKMDLVYYNPEFGVSDKINEGIDRLISLLQQA